MSREGRQNETFVSLDRVSEAVVVRPSNWRSDLFHYLTQNRDEFARRRPEHTWAQWAEAFERYGIRGNSTGPLTGRTLRQTWWRVRKFFGDPVADPILDAEKAKRKRRSPRKPTPPRPSVVLQPGEVAPGVRLVHAENSPEPKSQTVAVDPFADLRERMRKG
jgi:hypothetical protein